MGDLGRDTGKRKMYEYEKSGESRDGAARRTRARTTGGTGGQNGAGGNPSLPPLYPRDDRGHNWPGPQQQPVVQNGGEDGGLRELQKLDLISQIDGRRTTGSSNGEDPRGDDRSRNGPPGPQQRPTVPDSAEEGDRVGHQTENVISSADRRCRRRVERWMKDPEVTGCFMATLNASNAQQQLSGGVGNPGTLLQMNLARDSRMTETQLAATMAPHPRPKAPSSSQAQHSSIQQPSSGAQRGGPALDGARGRNLQKQARALVTAGQPGAAKGALGSGQLQSRANASAVVQCPACQNNPHADRCPLRGKEAGNLAIGPRPRQPPPPHQQGLPPARANQAVPHQQGLPPARTNQAALVRLQSYIMLPYRHVLLQPAHPMCPACLRRPGFIVPYPWGHSCLCAVCRSCRLVCPFCVRFLPLRLRPPR